MDKIVDAVDSLDPYEHERGPTCFCNPRIDSFPRNELEGHESETGMHTVVWHHNIESTSFRLHVDS